MLGFIREKFSAARYTHDYHPSLRTRRFHVYKNEGGYHLYDLAVFIIIFVFLCAYFRTVFNIDDKNQSIGYILVVMSVIGISALMF